MLNMSRVSDSRRRAIAMMPGDLCDFHNENEVMRLALSAPDPIVLRSDAEIWSCASDSCALSELIARAST